MKTHKLAGSVFALLLTALGASSAVAQTNTAAILFTRVFYEPVTDTFRMELGRVKPSGEDVVRLAPFTYGVENFDPAWSPAGAAVVYTATEPNVGRPAQLYVVNRQGGNLRKITTGPGRHRGASWGPNGIIAFITDDNRPSHYCLGTVRPDGTQQRILFCPPRPTGATDDYMLLSRPQWSPSGNSVYVVADTDEGVDGSRSFSNTYRVNVSTGAVVKIAGRVIPGSIRHLTIAPDGKHGVYEGDPLQVIDFATGTLRPLPTYGFSPLYSRDGRKIAFSRSDDGYLHVYVVHTDGSHLHPIQVNPDPEADYEPFDWSFDGTRVLVTKQKAGEAHVQIIDLRNYTVTRVIHGGAGLGAWFHP
ncbi:TolB family protein [Frateuria sp. GZRe12]|uniref:TolB family protein n=1 Tax=Frateuria sp. GZRe12 TaxID=3351533 RepID=UPI003EDC9861